MKTDFSPRLEADIVDTLDSALRRHGIINIPLLAEQIRSRNQADNVALEDIAERLMLKAQSRNAAMEFDSPLSFDKPVATIL